MNEILKYFLKLGFTGFGGPIALVGMMQEELVIKRKWIDPEEFKQAIVLIKAMPGPLAFQTATYICYRRSGFWGALLGGVALILPASVLVLLIAMVLPGINTNPLARAFLIGCQISALWIMGFTLVPLISPQLKNKKFWILFLLSLIPLWFWPTLEPLLIFAFGLIMIAWNKNSLSQFKNIKNKFNSIITSSPVALTKNISASTLKTISIPELATASSMATATPHLNELLWVSIKAGSLVFGTGIAIIPMLESDFVQRLHWINHSEFMNALAFGQITPGPISVTITYIGFKTLGMIGAVSSTIAVFLPSFFHMTTWFPRAQKTLARQTWIGSFCNGALACVGASIITSVLRLFLGFEWNLTLALTLLICIFIHLKWRLPTWAIIPGTGILYLLASFFK